jgi:hypothetical protein
MCNYPLFCPSPLGSKKARRAVGVGSKERVGSKDRKEGIWIKMTKLHKKPNFCQKHYGKIITYVFA